MIKGVIFDMDGLLIDSEPLWQQAEIKIFGQLGIKLTREMCLPLQGKKLTEVIKYWYDYQPWENASFEEVERMIINEMKNLLQNNLMKKYYADEIIKLAKNLKFKTAVASSSYLELIYLVLNKANWLNFIDVVHSSELEKRGKPYPDIFLTTAKMLGLQPDECIVLEDSPNGIKAAKKAGMQVIAVPDSFDYNNPAFDLADYKVKNLQQAAEILREMGK